MLLDAGAAHVVAVEPSDAFDVLLRNTAERKDRITYVRATGDQLPANLDLDLVTCIGVLHHIEHPGPVLDSVLRALRPGGVFIAWIYAREGNELYLRFALPLRALTRLLPDSVLHAISHPLTWLLAAYVGLCRFLPLPMRAYMRNVLGHYGYYALRLTVFDQLNPAYAKYYSGQEAGRLLGDHGFVDVRMHHRHGYSWTLTGRKP
jgi:SAM-dependent methyltransferase